MCGKQSESAKVRRIYDVHRNAKAAAEGGDLDGHWRPPASGDKNGIHIAVDFCSTKSLEVVLSDLSLYPLHLVLFNAFCEAVMDVSIVWGDYNGYCADFEGFGATGTSDRVGTDDQVDVGGRVYRGEEFGGHVDGEGGATR